MATYDITGPDGQKYRINAPDGATQDDVLAYAQKSYKLAAAPKPETGVMDSIKQGAGNLIAGAVRGAGSIGATLLAPIDYATDYVKGDRGKTLSSLITGKELPSRNEERRAAMDAALGSMGAETDSFGYGAGKLAGEIAGTAGMGGVIAKPLQALAASKYASGIEPLLDGVIKSLQTGGFRVGPLAGTGAGTAARVAGGAAVGGASAGLVNPEDAGFGALVGGALPSVAQVAGLAGNKIRSAVTGGGIAPEVELLAKRASDIGINIPADRLVNSKPLNAVASTLNYVPFSGRAATENGMQDQLNKAVTRTFGQDSTNVTQALRKAQSDLGAKFDDVLKNNTVKVDQQFMNDLAESANRASSELGQNEAAVIGRQVDDILSKAGTGKIDGQAAYNIKRTLDRIGQQNTPTAHYALDLKKTLMGALDRSLPDGQAAAFAETRKQYGNMLALQKLAQNGAEGDISIARLANMKNINNKDLQELADISAQFLKPREGQHGSMQRAVVGAVGAASGGIPAMIGGAIIGRTLNGALNSTAAKNFLLRNPGLLADESATLGLLTQGAYRAAPLLQSQ